jgi:hypothetical protein
MSFLGKAAAFWCFCKRQGSSHKSSITVEGSFIISETFEEGSLQISLASMGLFAIFRDSGAPCVKILRIRRPLNICAKIRGLIERVSSFQNRKKKFPYDGVIQDE